ncbi:MAG: peptide deformylase [Gemmatimonas sp. 13_1_20CM_3_60_15]|nr:MAG: peptide deformylase [Gemmatimonas sp. 13_1_20CM_3_60_15]
MSILDIRVLGDPVLRKPTKRVTEVTDELRQLIADMFETMYAAEGIGLAAPQVGRAERLAVVDVEGNKFTLINPEVIERTGDIDKAEEGCLSIPDIYGDVERPFTVTIRAMNENGEQYEATASELLGRCFQHEIDHLDGKLFLDYLSPLKRKAAMAKWESAKTEYPGFIRKVKAEVPGEHHHETEM